MIKMIISKFLKKVRSQYRFMWRINSMVKESRREQFLSTCSVPRRVVLHEYFHWIVLVGKHRLRNSHKATQLVQLLTCVLSVIPWCLPEVAWRDLQRPPTKGRPLSQPPPQGHPCPLSSPVACKPWPCLQGMVTMYRFFSLVGRASGRDYFTFLWFPKHRTVSDLLVRQTLQWVPGDRAGKNRKTHSIFPGKPHAFLKTHILPEASASTVLI